jgi:hypothetical protein
MNFVYAPTNKIEKTNYPYRLNYLPVIKTPRQQFRLYAYDIDPKTNNYILADYTELLTKLMAENKDPFDIYNYQFFKDVNGIRHIKTAGLTLGQVKEIIDNNVAMITKFNTYAQDYYLIRELSNA